MYAEATEAMKAPWSSTGAAGSTRSTAAPSQPLTLSILDRLNEIQKRADQFVRQIAPEFAQFNGQR